MGLGRSLAFAFYALRHRGPLSGHAQHRPITAAEGSRLAKKPNYDFEKRRKELERKQKKDAKREERQQRRRAGVGEDGDVAEGDTEDATEDETAADTPAAS